LVAGINFPDEMLARGTVPGGRSCLNARARDLREIVGVGEGVTGSGRREGDRGDSLRTGRSQISPSPARSDVCPRSRWLDDPSASVFHLRTRTGWFGPASYRRPTCGAATACWHARPVGVGRAASARGRGGKCRTSSGRPEKGPGGPASGVAHSGDRQVRAGRCEAGKEATKVRAWKSSRPVGRGRSYEGLGKVIRLRGRIVTWASPAATIPQAATADTVLVRVKTDAVTGRCPGWRTAR